MSVNVNETLVKVDEATKYFKRGSEEIHVLEKLDMQVPEGEFLALMGPSGSGKSTLLNLIGGLDRPTSGSVTVGGERIDRLSRQKLAAWRARHVGLVFQFYNLLPVLTAERNVELPLLLTHLSRAQRKKHVDAALDVVGLSHRKTPITRGRCRAVSSSAWASPAASSATRRCFSLTSRPATSIASRGTRFSIFCKRSTKTTTRPLSW